LNRNINTSKNYLVTRKNSYDHEKQSKPSAAKLGFGHFFVLYFSQFRQLDNFEIDLFRL
tara:strand:- start:8369 stop:8545 length:177 start_codon:yes stop_codon:yes gene_type:complete